MARRFKKRNRFRKGRKIRGYHISRGGVRL
nr:MAG TPA: hypothetical protein [Microviridae sp.]